MESVDLRQCSQVVRNGKAKRKRAAQFLSGNIAHSVSLNILNKSDPIRQINKNLLNFWCKLFKGKRRNPVMLETIRSESDSNNEKNILAANTGTNNDDNFVTSLARPLASAAQHDTQNM
ncbi:hypothetical protein X798_04346 [Onchocerca flexuosa]|uniref:Uncharacterized protein n=1 Tax=Onchocerca flexuosa TaxID=387005 RepID=A0A238BVD5_9BILA|nr:hypothetical protein X798_04346 [Onchocerca flexuosa]